MPYNLRTRAPKANITVVVQTRKRKRDDSSQKTDNEAQDKKTTTESLPGTQPPKDCSICLEAVLPANKAILEPCLHEFDYICIDQWVKANATCPYCRTPSTGLRYEIISETDFKHKPIQIVPTVTGLRISDSVVLVIPMPNRWGGDDNTVWVWATLPGSLVRIEGEVEEFIHAINPRSLYRLRHYNDVHFIKDAEGNVINIQSSISEHLQALAQGTAPQLVGPTNADD